MVLKRCARTSDYVPTDAFADAPRTTSGVDRLMTYQDRILLAMRYFHLSPGRRPTLLKSDGDAVELSPLFRKITTKRPGQTFAVR